MNTVISKWVCVGVALAGSALVATAGPEGRHPKATPRVTKRQVHQEVRIGQGIRSGQLTKDEAKQLQGDQKELRQEKKEYRADGVVTTEERKDLRQDTRQNSRTIYQEKHDAEVRAKK